MIVAPNNLKKKYPELWNDEEGMRALIVFMAERTKGVFEWKGKKYEVSELG